jgi:hypothetical protein
MMKSTLLAAILLGAFPLASAEGSLLLGHIQRVIHEPSGTGSCRVQCPALITENADGSRTLCYSRNTACETMDFKVDQVLVGEAGATRQFKARGGEFGPFFHAVSGEVLVSEEAGSVHWAQVIERDGKKFIDPKRLWKFGGVSTSAPGDGELVPLDEVLARIGVRQ